LLNLQMSLQLPVVFRSGKAPSKRQINGWSLLVSLLVVVVV